jgi:hypothetical protein
LRPQSLIGQKKTTGLLLGYNQIRHEGYMLSGTPIRCLRIIFSEQLILRVVIPACHDFAEQNHQLAGIHLNQRLKT